MKQILIGTKRNKFQSIGNTVKFYFLFVKFCFRYAPESIRIDSPVYTHKSDVWSFGICVWEILTLCEKSSPYVEDEPFIKFRELKENAAGKKLAPYALILEYLNQKNIGEHMSYPVRSENIFDILFSFFVVGKEY